MNNKGAEQSADAQAGLPLCCWQHVESFSRVKAQISGDEYCWHMGESFHDYSRIQDFEADFQQKVRLKILNWADYNILVLI